VLDIAEQKTAVTNADLFDRFKKIKSKDVTIMTRQLATMVASGMSLLRCFYVLHDQTESDKLKEIIAQIRTDIEAGISLSDALERHPDTFSRLYTSMTRTGETAGMLEESLIRIAEQLEAQDSLRRQVRAAMAYPMMIGVFSDFNGKLPAITRVTVMISHFVTGQWYLLIGGTVGLVTGIKKMKKTDWGRSAWDAFKLKIPAQIGTVIHKIALARWSRTFSGLVHSGVPILQAIEITGATSGNVHMERAMDDVRDSVQKGGSVSDPLRRNPLFPTMVGHMVGVGEETGNLDGMLAKIADFYEDEVDASVKALTSILEPVMIIVVGGIVGFIVVSMYLPLFQVYENIR
jgi:type IV pilus assembly protein PilC